VSPAKAAGANATVDIMELIIGMLVFLLDIWAIIGVLQSGVASRTKLAWVIGIVIFPLIGFFVWLLAGPKGRAVFI
jgi:hypothetical protein